MDERGGPAGPARPARPPLIELVPAPGGGWAVDPRWAPPRPPRPRWGLAAALFAVSLFTTTTLGAVWLRWARGVGAELPLLTPATVAAVWTDPALLALGLSFSLPVLAILLCHELGHSLACRRHRLPATPPFFLPAPFGVGTAGAFIRIRAPIRTKRELFDVGIWGPLAGFAALVPFLLAGIARSRPAPLDAAPLAAAGGLLLVPGDCLAVRLATSWFHGPLPDGTVLDLHPFALAAWFGLLATAINLLPLGQLDGGHILYALASGRHRRVTFAVAILLVPLAIYYWLGWLIWAVLLIAVGYRHPPLLDRWQPLDRRRRSWALVALAIFILCFMPAPLAV